MADKKISALPAATTPLAGTEVLPIVQSGATDQVSVANLTAGRDVSVKKLITTDNAGIGLTPDAWGADWKMAQFSNGASVGGFLSKFTILRQNVYGATGGDIYIANGYASDYYQVDGTHVFRTATSGTAGGAASLTNLWTMDATGNLIPAVAAKGVNFTANTPAAGMTSQLLNWYEEGTWTPAIASGGGTITAGTTAGYYTRIGRQVTFNCYVSVSSVSSPTGDVTISGLPFTSFNNTNNLQSFSVYSDGLTAGATTSLVSTMGGNATTFIVRVWGAGGAGYAAPYVQAGAYFRISGSYFV